jgi:hypothetical protein
MIKAFENYIAPLTTDGQPVNPAAIVGRFALPREEHMSRAAAEVRPRPV